MLYKFVVFLLLTSVSALTSSVLLASDASAEWKPENMKAAPKDQGWSLSLENDLLAGGARDKDFTYGLNFVHRGERSREWLPNPTSLHARLDTALGFHKPAGLQPRGPRLHGHSLELGLYGFTPEDISQAEVIEDDRPYASLVYATSTHNSLDVVTDTALSSSLSIGVLGLDVVGELQNGLHAAVEGKEAQGWDQQISDGGEPTFRYALAKQRLLQSEAEGFEAKSSLQVSLGYITETSYSLSFRKGQLNSRWWEFDPELTLYGENASPANAGASEHYLWGGVAIKARAYNSFLQGQFRESAHSYQFSDLQHLLLEAWAGYTVSFAEHYRFSYLLRAHSSELREGTGDRNLIWGGVVLSKNLD